MLLLIDAQNESIMQFIRST